LLRVLLVSGQTRVAPEAEEATHATCLMVVVYGEAATGCAMLAADCTAPSLPFQERRILRLRDAPLLCEKANPELGEAGPAVCPTPLGVSSTLVAAATCFSGGALRSPHLETERTEHPGGEACALATFDTQACG
jgi:hypothetical protein